MILKVYAVRDAKAECYLQPLFKITHGEAERDFKTLTKDEKSTVNKYPEDYDLYYLGEYDNIRGVFKPLDTPQHIAKAAALIN